MGDNSVHVVPCTPQLRCNHSTPLSIVSSRRFYNSISPRSPAIRLRREEERLLSNSSTPHASSLTPILRVGARQRVSFSNDTPVQLRPRFTPIWKLQREYKPNLSVYQNQVVPNSPLNIHDSGLGQSKTRIKPQKPKQYGSRSPTVGQENQVEKPPPYFTPDDEDIFLDTTRDSPLRLDESDDIFDV